MPATVYELLGGKHADEIAEKTCRTLTLFASYLQVSFSVGRDLSSQPGFVTRVLDEPLALDPDTELSKIAFRFFHFDPTFGPAGKTAVTIFDTGGRYAAGDQAADLAVQHSGGISWGRDAQGAANIPACEPIFGVAEGAANVSKGFLRDYGAAMYNSAPGPMSVNGMARPSSYPAGERCCDGARPNEHRRVQQINRDHCPDGHRYRQEFVPRRRARSARRDRAATEVVTRPA